MQTRLIRLRWHRRLKHGQRQVEDIGLVAEENIEKHLLKRLDKLLPVRRFVIGWVGLLILLLAIVFGQNLNLSNYYQVTKTIPGGIYSEGLLGTFSNANPIYATSDADISVSSLIFAGLFKDNSTGQLVGDLASSYSIDKKGTTYTVYLKPNLKWQDGYPLTAKDVVFTFQTIQNPDADSPLFSSWQGIKVSAPNSSTVVFKLPDILATFPYSLTTGILPMHLLANIPPANLRSADFNTLSPVGAGPFSMQSVQVVAGNDPDDEQFDVTLNPYLNYVGGAPNLDKFEVHIFANQDELYNAFSKKQLTAMETVDIPSKKIQNKKGVVDNSFILRAANMVFFKTSSGILSDTTLRNALVQGTDVPAIISTLGYPTLEVNEPLLRGQLGYDPSYAQYSYNLSAAKTSLNNDGWLVKPGMGGLRYKAYQPLTFTLTASDTTESMMVTNELKDQWKKLGVNVNVQTLDPLDYQTALSYHQYQAVLASITIGVDPDVYDFWDSSQADIRSANRLNFSEFSNPTADEALETARTVLDPQVRTIKYHEFLQVWQQQSPALGLYQPRLLYLTNGYVGGLNNTLLSTASDRYSNVQNWEIKQAKVNN